MPSALSNQPSYAAVMLAPKPRSGSEICCAGTLTAHALEMSARAARR